MTRNNSIVRKIAEQLGDKLYTACVRDNVAEVEVLTTNDNCDMDVAKWSAALIAAGLGRATNVAAYCSRYLKPVHIQYYVLVQVWCNESLDPVYRFLVDSDLVSISLDIDHVGQMLGALAGQGCKRHPLVKYLLEKGANPNQRVFCHGEKYALASAAGESDQQMLELLLDYGAQITGTGALLYAAWKGKEDNVKYLLTRGADVNELVSLFPPRQFSIENIGSPLHKAAEHNRVAIIDVLLNAGADVTLKDTEGRTVADIAEQQKMATEMLAKLS